MKTATMLAAACAAMAATAMPLGAATAQDYPLEAGTLMEVTGVDIEDGGAFAYAEFIAGQWRRNQEFAKSKGWISDYKVLSNVHPREGEPDLYLVVYFPSIPDAAEEKRRQGEFRAFMKQSDAQMAAASGDRAKIRHLAGTMLLSEMRFK